MIAALYVARDGVYYGLPDVDPWDEARDARTYAGPHPVVAHPPCSRWCQLAGLVQARWGHRVGDDGGCFATALEAVRRWGGVLEHPAHTSAWAAFGLPKPARSGGWTNLDAHGGRACHVEQGHYGHRARKATWLYAVSWAPLPAVACGPSEARAWCSYMGNHTRGQQVGRLTKRAAKATPLPFRDLLLSIAREARGT